MFTRLNEKGEVIRNRVGIDCQKAVEDGEKVVVEQSHKQEVDINNIVKRHGIDLIAQTQNVQALEFDDVTTNDFQEAMFLIAKGKTAFESLPSKIRAEFENDAAKYMDYVHNPDNHEEMIKRGWMNPKPEEPQPVQVVVTNPPETPPA